ncbi:MAG: ATP-binding protein, partial [Chitinophagales bacterium]|nr:ATP-binding protein [Chitinophagales bacterium]
MSALLPAAEELWGEEPKFLFLDEIQLMPGWSKWLRRIHETTDIKLFVTGSNSKMSSHEIPTELRGRFIEQKVFPLSFREFLSFRNFDLDEKYLVHDQKQLAHVKRLLREYLSLGGLPEVVLADDSLKDDIVQSYFRTVVSRDIMELHRVRNDRVLKLLLKMLLNGKEYTVNKLYNTLKSMQHEIGKATIQQYIGYAEDAYFMRSVHAFSHSIKDATKHPRKLYCVDNSFLRFVSTKFSHDTGR